jgi:hypothetical protein
LPQRTTPVLEFYFFHQFQIGLPLEWIAIILRGTGIGPVGASQDKQVSGRRKRLHAP